MNSFPLYNKNLTNDSQQYPFEATIQKTDAQAGLEKEIQDINPEYRITGLALNSLAAIWSKSKKTKLTKKTEQAIVKEYGSTDADQSTTVSAAINDVLFSHDIIVYAKVEHDNSIKKASEKIPRKSQIELITPQDIGLAQTREVARLLRTRIEYLRGEIAARKLALKASAATSNTESNEIKIPFDARYMSENELKKLEQTTNKLLYKYNSAVKFAGTNDPGTVRPDSKTGEPESYYHNIIVEKIQTQEIFFN